MKKIILTLSFVFLFVFPAQAAISPELLAAVPKIYAGNFSGARNIINKHIADHPDDPAGYLLRGMANEWYQVLRNKGKSMNSTIMDDYQKARKMAADALEKDKNNISKKVMYANALAYVSKKNIDTGHKAQAGFNLKKAKNLMNEVIAKDPNNTQAYFIIGMFNYFSANVPSGMKWLASLMGFHGNAAKGISYIKKAASSPNLFQGDAQFILVYIYSHNEGKYAQALPYAQRLSSRYPNNQIFLFDLAEMQFRTKKIDESRKNFEKFFAYCNKYQGRCSRKYLYLANYFMTWSYMNEKDYAGAKKYIGDANKLNTKKYKDRTSDLVKWSKILDKK